MSRNVFKAWIGLAVLLGGFVSFASYVRADGVSSTADSVAALCEDGQCQPVISQIEFFGRTAYRLTDGKSEAIVVPQIGRIMSYGRVGGANLLWNAPTTKGINWGWLNYGGDKGWLAPQSSWPLWTGKAWPPDTAFDGMPYEAEVLSGGKLRLTAPLSPATGIRMVRTLYFNTAGEFVIEQTAKKEQGAPVRAALWSITQTVPGQAVYMAANPDSPYEGRFHLTSEPKSKDSQSVELVKPNLLRIVPRSNGVSWKVGVDSPVAGLVSVRDGVAFLQKTARPDGDYPDGADRAGFPVELYVNAAPKLFYYEMELLGPLKDFRVGSAWTHTVRWSLHDMPSRDVSAPEVVDAVEKLLGSLSAS